jgi:hypothetical protein
MLHASLMFALLSPHLKAAPSRCFSLNLVALLMAGRGRLNAAALTLLYLPLPCTVQQRSLSRAGQMEGSSIDSDHTRAPQCTGLHASVRSVSMLVYDYTPHRSQALGIVPRSLSHGQPEPEVNPLIRTRTRRVPPVKCMASLVWSTHL